MNSIDERARRAAASVHRLADTVDPEEVLERIEGRPGGRRWVVPAVALASAAAVAVGAVALSGILTDTTPRIEDGPGVIGTPGNDATWPPEGTESEDGWVRIDPSQHGMDVRGLNDLVTFDGTFLLLGQDGRLWRSTDGITWENRAGLAVPDGQLVVDRGRVVAMGVVDDGRELRVLWSEDGDTWTTVENRGQLSVSVGEAQWFQPVLVTGPRGFLIASAVWLEQPSSGGATTAANLGAKIRVLESPDGETWATTTEWDNEGVADLVGVAGDTNGYTLVFQGDDVRSEVNKGTVRAFVSGDEDWVELTDHPGGQPVRVVRDRPVPVVGDGPQGDDLTAPAVRFHTWEFALERPGFGGGLFLRTAGGWQEAQFDGASGPDAGVTVHQVWDAGDALYTLGSVPPELATTLYRSTDGVTWVSLRRDPVFTGARVTGGEVHAATVNGRSVVAHDCCVPGVYDNDTQIALWVRQAPAPTGEDPGPEPSPVATFDHRGCGTEGMSPEPSPQPGLPDAVQAMRVEIASAAVNCDHELLAQLAGEGFTASFGGSDATADWWRDSDLRLLRLLLDLPYASATSGDGLTYYAWPSAFLESTDEAWRALYDAGLATPEDRARMEEAFDGWVGFRHGITEAGDWIFYVAGD